MREIKFRAWDKEYKMMVYVLEMKFLFESEKGIWIQGYANDRIDCEIFPENIILMQYTGLRDKNGKEIYDGDVLDEGDNYDSVVEWSNYMEGPCFCLHEYYPEGEEDRWHSMEAYTTYPYHVIGNIYENPEFIPGDTLVNHQRNRLWRN